MALFKKITPATSSQLEANNSQHLADPGSQCPWVPVTTRTASLDSGSEGMAGKKRYLCDLYNTIGMEKNAAWSSTASQPSTILPSLSFGKTETRMLREAYQKTSESLDVVQGRLRTVEQALLTLQTTMSRIVGRQDEIYDTLQDLAVMTAATQKKRQCVQPPSPESADKSVVEQTPPTAPSSPPIMSQYLPSPLSEILSTSDSDALTVPPPPPPPPQSCASCVHSPHTEVFQSEWLEE